MLTAVKVQQQQQQQHKIDFQSKTDHPRRVTLTLTYQSHVVKIKVIWEQLMPWLHVKQNYFKIMSAVVDVRLE